MRGGWPQQTSCGQQIAADGVFAAAMLAEYRAPLETLGPWFYRRLHWEAGVVGQQLYLEAEASGIRATGIGCFFDDLTHRTFGHGRRRFQVLYHFTMGGAIDDVRLQTVPPYQHLQGARPHDQSRTCARFLYRGIRAGKPPPPGAAFRPRPAGRAERPARDLRHLRRWPPRAASDRSDRLGGGRSGAARVGFGGMRFDGVEDGLLTFRRVRDLPPNTSSPRSAVVA